MPRRLLFLLLFALGCPSVEPSPPPEPTPSLAAQDDPPDPTDESLRADQRWLEVFVAFEDPAAMWTRIQQSSGALYLALTDVRPALEEPAALEAIGGFIPELRVADLDGDGDQDLLWPVEPAVFEVEGNLEDGMLFGPAKLAGSQAGVSLVGLDFFGKPWLRLDSEGRRRLEEPGASVAFSAVAAPGGPGSCHDGQDDDGDGWTDAADPDCRLGSFLLEGGPRTAVCNDGVDNDGDGLVDADDAGCRHGADISEQPSCSDGLDDDGDGWIDDADPDCPGEGERGYGSNGCNDGADNDGDGRADAFDADCAQAEGSE
jgi:hypothetical protein